MPEFLVKSGCEMWQALLGDISSVYLTHALTKECIDFKGMSDDGIPFWCGLPKAGDGWYKVAFECFNNATYGFLFGPLLGLALCGALLVLDLEVVISKSVVALGHQLE